MRSWTRIAGRAVLAGAGIAMAGAMLGPGTAAADTGDRPLNGGTEIGAPGTGGAPDPSGVPGAQGVAEPLKKLLAPAKDLLAPVQQLPLGAPPSLSFRERPAQDRASRARTPRTPGKQAAGKRAPEPGSDSGVPVRNTLRNLGIPMYPEGAQPSAEDFRGGRGNLDELTRILGFRVTSSYLPH